MVSIFLFCMMKYELCTEAETIELCREKSLKGEVGKFSNEKLSFRRGIYAILFTIIQSE